ncbi:MAG: MFS transporter [Planctomycetota bacterium]|nr:MFS transporter [Planctomycetota bacterium]
MPSAPSPLRRSLGLLVIVLSGEAIFLLPFLVPRVFRPLLLDVFGISNLQLGTAFSLYGVVAMASYFPGGPLADRFAARKLMTAALLITALGGVYFASIPTLAGLKSLYGFWGVTTILLFWSALIRATREWGGSQSQGLAYGILEGGRGLFAAILALVSTLALRALLPADAAEATHLEKVMALQQVIWIYTGMATVAAVLVWFFVAEPALDQPQSEGDKFSAGQILNVLKNPAVWLQGLIVICAYTGYKGADDFGLYARDVFDYDDVQAAFVSTLSLWVRPITALLAGALADRIGAARGVLCCFVGLLLGDLVVASGFADASTPWVLYMTVVGAGAMTYALRGIYFALFPDARVSATLTGTAAGLVSVIGYTPDIFMGPLMGYLTDTYPGALGHEYFFAALAVFAACGLTSTICFQWVCAGNVRPAPPTTAD